MLQALLALVHDVIYTFSETAVKEQPYSRQYAVVLSHLCLVFLMKAFILSKLINSFLKLIYTSALFPVKLQFHVTNFRVILGKNKTKHPNKMKKSRTRYEASFVMTSDVELLTTMDFMG